MCRILPQVAEQEQKFSLIGNEKNLLSCTKACNTNAQHPCALEKAKKIDTTVINQVVKLKATNM